MDPLQTLAPPPPPARSRSPLGPRRPTDGDLTMSPSLRSASLRSGRENIPSPHPNVQIAAPPSPLKKPPPPASISDRTSPEPSVKVVVRMRPANRHERGDERIAQKLAPDSLSVGSRTFAFSSVLGSEATQEDVFNLVGVPLVKNSLAGFNTSIVSYGQTGSGKTYTMWGPPSAMVDGCSISSYLGIVPRIFQMLFSEINREQENSEEQQINYQCRCSFLEVYNNQINDLLDPTQRNLQIKGDATNDFHVENLTDQYVTAVEDVTQLLVKGLSSRKVGTTSINSKSSRSHILFTCVVESWCKGSSSKGFGSSKTSRITLVDLAGSDTDKPDDVSIKEDKYVKKSLSKLGKLVNILAEDKSLGKDQKIPYMDSCLTHLLHETLGGNAKITFICTIFPNDRHKAGTLSTLRFGERAIRIQNKAVINEITEDDVNGLSDQIRQLKDELIKAKSYRGNSVGTAGGYFKGRNARDSLNLLRVSLNRSLMLPHIDDDSEEEMDVDEEDVRELCVQLTNINPSSEDNSEEILESKDTAYFSSLDSHLGSSCSQELSVSLPQEERMLEEVQSETSEPEVRCNSDLICKDVTDSGNYHELSATTDSLSKSSISISSSAVPDDPTMCESPKISNKLRRSIINLEDYSAGGKYASDTQCFMKCDNIRSSLQSSKVCPTESLAASLHRGLQIIDYHQQISPVKRSFIGLSFEHLTSITRQPLNKVDACMQTSTEAVASSSPFLCSSCRKMFTSDHKPGGENNEMLIVTTNNDAGTPEILKKQVFEGGEKISADNIRIEMGLETSKTTTINQLDHVASQYNHELEESSSADQNQHTQVLCFDGASATKELKNEEDTSQADGYAFLKERSFDASASATKELKNEEDTSQADGYAFLKERSFDASERKTLLEEIQSLRTQLKSYTDVSEGDSPLEMIRNGSSVDKKEDIEKERQKWTESESRWISLAEELRIDLELNRKRAEKKEMELNKEKKCTAELDDALKRAILGHARFIEHYAELQEKHESLLWSHRKVMEGIAEVKKAAAKAGGKRAGSAFVSALAGELSTLRVEREKERAHLKEQNRALRTQLRDTAEAVHAAGELLVRLREAEEAASVTEEKYVRAQQETEKLKKQIEKMKKKHAMEMVTMKHYIAESRLPESALEPFYLNDSTSSEDPRMPLPDDDQSWRAAFKPSYQ